MSNNNTKHRKAKKAAKRNDTYIPTGFPAFDTAHSGFRRGALASFFAPKPFTKLTLLKDRKVGEVAWFSNETKFDFDKMELAAAANALAPKRDEFDRPVWPPELTLVNGRHPLAGKFGGLCYRTACQRPNAVWYNRGSYEHYCEDCAKMLNRENRRSWRELQENYLPENRDEGEMCILVDKPGPAIR